MCRRGNVGKTETGHSGQSSTGSTIPLFRVLTVNLIINKLNRKKYSTVAYADDLAILISGEFTAVIGELMHTALDRMLNWSSNIRVRKKSLMNQRTYYGSVGRMINGSY